MPAEDNLGVDILTMAMDLDTDKWGSNICTNVQLSIFKYAKYRYYGVVIRTFVDMDNCV